MGVHFKAYWAAESFTSNSQAAGLVTGSLPLAAPPLVSLKKRIKRAKSGEGTHRKGSSRGLSDSTYEIYHKRGTRGSPPKRNAKPHDFSRHEKQNAIRILRMRVALSSSLEGDESVLLRKSRIMRWRREEAAWVCRLASEVKVRT